MNAPRQPGMEAYNRQRHAGGRVFLLRVQQFAVVPAGRNDLAACPAIKRDGARLYPQVLRFRASLYSVTFNSHDNGSIFTPVYNVKYWGDTWYSTAWQVQHIDLAAKGAVGHDIQLTLLASDCPYGGHAGYVYLDGFAPVVIPPSVPEPASLVLLASGGLFLAGKLRRRK